MARGSTPAAPTGTCSRRCLRRFRYVTALDDLVPPGRLGELVARLLGEFVEPGGRLIVSSYTDSDGVPRPLFDDLGDAGYPPDGLIRIDRPR